MDAAGRELRIGRLRARLVRLSGDQWQGVAGELQALLDQEPGAACAHVLAWRAAVRARHADSLGLIPGRGVAARVESAAPVYEARRVPDPTVGVELGAAIAAGEVRMDRMVGAVVNVSSLIGGLARVRGRTALQEQAAAKYRSIREGAMIGAGGAIDYGQPRVDTSLSAAALAGDGGSAFDRMEYADAYAAMVQRVGMIGSRVVELVVGEGCSIHETAARLGQHHTRGRLRVRELLLRALDLLVAHFRLGGAPCPRVVGDGERPSDTSARVVMRGGGKAAVAS